MKVVTQKNIRSSLGPFNVLSNHITVYPKVVVETLGELYREYNLEFSSLIEKNREWETDYRYCMHDDTPVNCCVQIDMAGFTEESLQEIVVLPDHEVRELVRRRIFEIENSVAMYQLLENLFPRNGSDPFFKKQFRSVLDGLREQFNMPIALLAVTQQKYDTMAASEFGKLPGEEVTDKEVMELSGFDAFFGPDQFQSYLDANKGICKHLLYVRSSDPMNKLKKPDIAVHHPLLSDNEMRRVIKAHAITFNIDAPDMEYARKINDTKEYMVSMNMAFLLESEKDLFSERFESYLCAQGIEPTSVLSGERVIRCKPAKCTYGCYGHLSGTVTSKSFLNRLKTSLHLRGSYIVQPEMETPITMIEGKEYTFIDRVFFGVIGGSPVFLGGVRNLMPTQSTEARAGRIHGNGLAVFSEIAVS